MNTLISIIIPVYNSEKYLDMCLRSILKQTYSHFEVIMINDGSQDDSLRICESFCAESDKFHLINQKNEGVDKARNKGLTACKGDFITFVDSDDYVEENWLQSYINTQEKFPSCDWIVQGTIIDWGTKKNKESLPTKLYRENEVIEGFFQLEKRYLSGFTHNKMYKRSIIATNALQFKYTLKEDLLFNIQYCQYVHELCILSDAHYHYIQRTNGSLIHKRYPPHYMRNLIKSLRTAGKALAKKYNNSDYEYFTENCYFTSFVALLASMYKTDGIKNKKERIAFIREYQQERKSNAHISLHFSSKSKKMFGDIAKLPATISDSVFSLLFPFMKKIVG